MCEYVDIDKLIPTESFQSVGAIARYAKNLKKDGSFKKWPALIINSEGEIFNGHHRFEAAKSVGIKDVKVVIIPDKEFKVFEYCENEESWEVMCKAAILTTDDKPTRKHYECEYDI